MTMPVIDCQTRPDCRRFHQNFPRLPDHPRLLFPSHCPSSSSDAPCSRDRSHQDRPVRCRRLRIPFSPHLISATRSATRAARVWDSDNASSRARFQWSGSGRENCSASGTPHSDIRKLASCQSPNPVNERPACSAQIRSGTRLESIVLASVSAETERAPAFSSVLAHSLSVVPVV